MIIILILNAISLYLWYILRYKLFYKRTGEKVKHPFWLLLLIFITCFIPIFNLIFIFLIFIYIGEEGLEIRDSFNSKLKRIFTKEL